MGTFILFTLLFALFAIVLSNPALWNKRGLKQAEDDGLQFNDDDEGEPDDDIGQADDYFFGDDDLTRLDDDDDGYDDDNDIVSFPPVTSDYQSTGDASTLIPAIIFSGILALF